MKNDFGLSKGLLSSVSTLLKDSSKQRAEESKAEAEKLAAHSKVASMRPLSIEDAKVASYAAKAPERRVNDTITQLYTQSVAEHNAKVKAEAEAIKNAYGKMGAAVPVAEAKQLSPKQKKIAAVAGDKTAIDAMDFEVLRNRKKAQAGAVSDEKILDGDAIDEAAYSAKAARAGKDIGKPGKNFAKIAAKSGEKVAGFVLKKIRQKHMKEDVEQVDELSSTTLGSYVKKATSDVRMNTNMARNTTGKQSDKFTAKAWKREDNVGKAVDRLTKEDVEQVDETSQVYRDAMAAHDSAGRQYRLNQAKHRMDQRAAEPKTLGQHIKKTLGEPLKKLAKGDVKGALSESGQRTMAEDVEQVDETYVSGSRTPEPRERYTRPNLNITKTETYTKPNLNSTKKTNAGSAKPSVGNASVIPPFNKGHKQNAIGEESDTPGNSYQHQCAIHVKHATMGEGRTLTSQHADPDEQGNIAWYDVMFEQGISRVNTTDLEILESEWHNKHPYSKSSKKMGIKPKKD